MEDKESILIVDDDESTRKTLTLIFRKEGFETETASTGREAIERAKKKFHNVALLDIWLPDMEGTEIIKPLREMHPDTAVVMVTAFASLETAVGALNKGASAYITKPLNMNEVLATIREALKKQRLVKENRQLEAQLLHAQKMEALGTLVAGIAHEINNPINLIMFNIPLLQKIWNDFQPILGGHAEKYPKKKYGGLTHDFVKQNLSQLMWDMDMAANRIARIVMSLKDFTKKSSASEKKAMQLNSAVETVLRLVQSMIKKSGVELEVELDQDLPPMEGNVHSVEQIILNLTINAIQAINGNRGKVKIVTGFQGQAERIFVSVLDNGPGIAPSICDKIFDPFVTSKQSEGGTGLGLSVTYNLVKAHDGDIEFETEKGKGTVFKVFFPVMKAEEKAEAEEEESRQLAIGSRQ